ncbi:MAG: hypothetical protein Q7S65_05220 [Nanoarchaeota archaeon]|nr:hypothetical protein [Nanoarchaeota archaeon]
MKPIKLSYIRNSLLELPDLMTLVESGEDHFPNGDREGFVETVLFELELRGGSKLPAGGLRYPHERIDRFLQDFLPGVYRLFEQRLQFGARIGWYQSLDPDKPIPGFPGPLRAQVYGPIPLRSSLIVPGQRTPELLPPGYYRRIVLEL